MRLTRHERIIVSRINKGEIYDIPSYLRHENLVFEVSQPVSQDEISMLYESVPCSKKRRSAKIKIEWDKRPGKDDGTEKYKPVTDIHQTVPTRRAEEFMDSEWKMNEDHLMMCHEFIEKRCTPQGHYAILPPTTIVPLRKCTED